MHQGFYLHRAPEAMSCPPLTEIPKERRKKGLRSSVLHPYNLLAKAGYALKQHARDKALLSEHHRRCGFLGSKTKPKGTGYVRISP